jgi:hypothetical protein
VGGIGSFVITEVICCIHSFTKSASSGDARTLSVGEKKERIFPKGEVAFEYSLNDVSDISVADGVEKVVSPIDNEIYVGMCEEREAVRGVVNDGEGSKSKKLVIKITMQARKSAGRDRWESCRRILV